ncbi:MAG: cellulase family glycosylhydrolase [Actinobacteria bacterium]|nr:cellulase family glycosylhydrolase [Actinomycetota bacterium]
MAHGYTTQGSWFIDAAGRHTLLRGVNFGGSTKVPYQPDGATHRPIDLAGARDVSFIGRPAPLDEVDRHLDRVAHWGFDVLRLLVTWEAIEHAGPGEHDEPYLDYVREIVRRASERDLLVFVDPHQDCWSRFSGGDGAPLWTFELAGLVPERFVPAGQALLDDFDWPANNQRVAAATMWTLFFGGDTFCEELAGVQGELQSRYLASIAAVAERVRDLDNVLGYDSLNEPSTGYIGKAKRLLKGTRFMMRVKDDFTPWSPIEYLAAGDGHSIERDGRVLNPEGLSVWRAGCPWRRAGVWDLDAAGVPVLASESYFKARDGREVDPWGEFMEPFIRRFRDEMRSVHPGCFVFVEGEPLQRGMAWDDPDPLIVNASHWYDVMTLSTRQFDPNGYHALSGETLGGVDAIAEEFVAQLTGFTDHSREHMSNRPLLLGEFGIPYEMNGGAAYRTGDYSTQRLALEANYRALDTLFVHGTQWSYTADNTHELGDQWNHEDLSIFSVSDIPSDATPDDLDAGGRAVEGFCRPYVRHAAGTPTRMIFDPALAVFQLDLDVDRSVAAPTVVYVPRIHFGTEPAIEVSDGGVNVHEQRLEWAHSSGGAQRLRIARA